MLALLALENLLSHWQSHTDSWFGGTCQTSARRLDSIKPGVSPGIGHKVTKPRRELSGKWFCLGVISATSGVSPLNFMQTSFTAEDAENAAKALFPTDSERVPKHGYNGSGCGPDGRVPQRGNPDRFLFRLKKHPLLPLGFCTASARFAGSNIVCDIYLGLTPGLYAAARSAGLG